MATAQSALGWYRPSVGVPETLDGKPSGVLVQLFSVQTSRSAPRVPSSGKALEIGTGAGATEYYHEHDVPRFTRLQAPTRRVGQLSNLTEKQRNLQRSVYPAQFTV